MKLFARIQTKHGQQVKHLNRRRAIRERCLNCSSWSEAEVRDCEATECALYSYRMGTGKQDPKARAKAIRAYCLRCHAGQRYEIKNCPSTDCPLFYFRNLTAIRDAKIECDAGTGHIAPVKTAKQVSGMVRLGIR